MSVDSKVKDIFVTCVLCLKKDAHNAGISSVLSRTSKLLKSNYSHYEILVVSDRDGERCDDEMSSCLKKIEHIRYMRAFGVKTYDELAAIGFDNAIGDITCAFPFDSVSEDDLIALVDKCCDGNDVVMNFKKDIRLVSQLKRFFAKSFGSIIGYGRIPDGFNGICCASRRAVNAAIKDIAFSKYPFLALAKADDLCASIEQIDCAEKSICSNYSIIHVMRMVSDLTTKHKRCACMSFMCISFVSALLAVIAGSLCGFLTSILFACAFYAAKMVFSSFERMMSDDSRNSTYVSYTIEFEKHSSVMLNTNELNIRDDSTSDTINNVQTGRDR